MKPVDYDDVASAYDQRTSGFMVIRDDQFATGLARLELEKPMLRADLRVWATTAVVP